MKKALIIGSALLLPVFASAQLTNVETNIVRPIGRIVDLLIPIVFAIALLLFFWGLATYIFASGDEAKKDEGKRKMIWGVVALFVMASIWGIINFLGRSIGITPGEGAIDVDPLIPR